MTERTIMSSVDFISLRQSLKDEIVASDLLIDKLYQLLKYLTPILALILVLAFNYRAYSLMLPLALFIILCTLVPIIYMIIKCHQVHERALSDKSDKQYTVRLLPGHFCIHKGSLYKSGAIIYGVDMYLHIYDSQNTRFSIELVQGNWGRKFWLMFEFKPEFFESEIRVFPLVDLVDDELVRSQAKWYERYERFSYYIAQKYCPSEKIVIHGMSTSRESRTSIRSFYEGVTCLGSVVGKVLSPH